MLKCVYLSIRNAFICFALIFGLTVFSYQQVDIKDKNKLGEDQEEMLYEENVVDWLKNNKDCNNDSIIKTCDENSKNKATIKINDKKNNIIFN